LQIGGRDIKTKIARQIRILHANTAFEPHQWTMFKRVFAHNVDDKKNGCAAYNKPLLSETFKCFPSEVKLVKRREDVRDDESRQVSHRHFFARVKTLTQHMLCSRRLGACKAFESVLSEQRRQSLLGLAVNCPYQASVQTPKLAQIYVYIIKTNLAETLVFRKMQSSFSDRLRRCSHLCLIS
jgi:hypothetical protein